DRLSAFDCILPTGIPQKGEVLNRLSAWWFEHTAAITPNHKLGIEPGAFPDILRPFEDILRGRAMLARKARPLPVECVVRGYLIGSGWKDYTRTGGVCGLPLHPGYRLADRLEQPLFTPARKADTGHDENISFEDVARMVGPSLAEQLRSVSLALYAHASQYARQRGVIIADTKFEFGLAGDELILIDELFTPDSSRFWPAAEYRPGVSPPSFDKQYVRDYLESLAWDKTPPAPPLPEDVVRKTTEKYAEAYRRITGREDSA
ncbi:MAG: phosphoribosylaminoimidazolesuccinocarboxamide synthase, partial [Verrucomicrobia bacterium]|nr:phosphoribosylaminoimidazolesuccinocarboxamide synthase [Verrucomicrobiota bacterium]